MTTDRNSFQAAILQGIPTTLPPQHQFPAGVNRAPKRKDILSRKKNTWPFGMHCAISQKNGMPN